MGESRRGGATLPNQLHFAQTSQRPCYDASIDVRSVLERRRERVRETATRRLLSRCSSSFWRPSTFNRGVRPIQRASKTRGSPSTNRSAQPARAWLDNSSRRVSMESRDLLPLFAACLRTETRKNSSIAVIIAHAVVGRPDFDTWPNKNSRPAYGAAWPHKRSIPA